MMMMIKVNDTNQWQSKQSLQTKNTFDTLNTDINISGDSNINKIMDLW